MKRVPTTIGTVDTYKLTKQKKFKHIIRKNKN